MKDRVVQHPHRYRMTNVNTGQELGVFDLTKESGLVTEEGTPINKNTLLRDDTTLLFEVLYGLKYIGTPTLDDVFKCITKYLGDTPRKLAVLQFQFSNTVDGAVQPFKNMPFTLKENGAATGTYTTDNEGKIFVNINNENATFIAEFQSTFPMWDAVKQVPFSVPQDQLMPTVIVDVGANFAFPKKFTSSITYQNIMPQFAVKEFDAFCVGGGSSGATNGGGGAGGYTSTVRNQTLGNTLSVYIGSGGSASSNHSQGGSTRIVGASIQCTANGGGSISSGQSTSYGADGGSGGGSRGNSSYYAGDGGSDGSNGGAGQLNSGGKGQGTTTRAFGEPDGELFAGGGGAGSSTSYSGGSGGAGGGGDAGRSGPNLYDAKSGQFGTGGGGGAAANSNTANGAGGSGVAMIRPAK